MNKSRLGGMNLDDFKNASKSFLKLNPGLGGLQAQGPKLHRGGQEQDCQLEEGPFRVVVRCDITAYRRRLLDAHENHPYSFKHLVDAIAADLGVPDADKRLIWRFYQVQIKDGREGVAVRIEVTANVQ